MGPNYSRSRTTWTSTNSDYGTGDTWSDIIFHTIEPDDPYYETITANSETEELEEVIKIIWLILWVIAAYQIILRKLIEQRTRGPPGRPRISGRHPGTAPGLPGSSGQLNRYTG